MHYIAAVSGGDTGSGIEGIKEMVLATNPLLESFGCAKTLRNDNSSRHVSLCRIRMEVRLIAIGKIPRDHVQQHGSAGRCSDHQLPARKGTCGRTDQGRTRFPHLLPVHKRRQCGTKGSVASTHKIQKVTDQQRHSVYRAQMPIPTLAKVDVRMSGRLMM
jgi:hypothetical protein